MTLQVIALFGLIVGFFSLFRISLLDFSGGIFNGILKKPENIRDAIMEERKTKKKSALRREIDEVTVIWRIPIVQSCFRCSVRFLCAYPVPVQQRRFS